MCQALETLLTISRVARGEDHNLKKINNMQPKVGNQKKAELSQRKDLEARGMKLALILRLT